MIVPLSLSTIWPKLLALMPAVFGGPVTKNGASASPVTVIGPVLTIWVSAGSGLRPEPADMPMAETRIEPELSTLTDVSPVASMPMESCVREVIAPVLVTHVGPGAWL